MIVYDGFSFATAPRTGATWFIRAAQLAGFGPGFHSHAVTPFPEENNKQIRVSLVRNPWQWLRSFHSHDVACNHVGKLGTIDKKLPFDRYVQFYLNHYAGAIGRLLLGYKADSFIKCEDLPDAFVELARSLGVSPAFLNNPFFHVLPWPDITAGFFADPALRHRVMSAEAELCEMADYL